MKLKALCKRVIFVVLRIRNFLLQFHKDVHNFRQFDIRKVFDKSKPGFSYLYTNANQKNQIKYGKCNC